MSFYIKCSKKSVFSKRLVLCVMIYTVAMVSGLRAADPLEQFLNAMSHRDMATMRTVVREHQQYMTTTFFGILEESTKLIQSSQEKDVLQKGQILLYLATNIAQVMHNEFSGKNKLYSQFKETQEILLPDVRMSIRSDLDLSHFLALCNIRLETPDERYTIVADLSSILLAYKEYRLIQDSFAEMINNLQQTKDLPALLSLLHDTSLGVERRHLVIGALGSLRDQAALDGLLVYLEDYELADAVTQALGEIGGERSSAALIGKLDDVRIGEQAEQMLVKIGPPASQALLNKFRSQGWSSGIKRAGQALVRLGFEPESHIDEERLLLSQDKALNLIVAGPTVLPVMMSAVTANDAGSRMTAIVVLATYIAPISILALALAFLLVGPWVRPSLKVTLARGTCTQNSYGRIVPGAWSQDPGTILETRWARDCLGRRQRIKVETLVSDFHTDDAIVSVGLHVDPGLYLARGRNRSVRVRVT